MQEYRKAFAIFDRDNSGTIELLEVLTLLRSLGHDTDHEDARRAIAFVDKNCNGSMEFCEFLQLIEMVQNTEDSEEKLVEVFRVIDQDGDGYISMGDLKEVIGGLQLNMTTQDLEEMLAEVDRDGDGLVDFDEFIKVCTTRV